jgi:hypothetical protein
MKKTVVYSAILLFLLLCVYPVHGKNIASEAVLFPKIQSGKGKLALVVESFHAKNAKGISRLADRVEIWLDNRRIASQNKEDPSVINEKKRRLFVFEPIELENGYYFVEIRLYATGCISARKKWSGEKFQVGIHPKKTTRISKKVPMIIW